MIFRIEHLVFTNFAFQTATTKNHEKTLNQEINKNLGYVPVIME